MSDAPADRIELRGLRVLGAHGVLPEERDRPQPFEVDADVLVDLSPACASDELSDTVDYGAVADRIVATVAGSHRALLESLATEAADAVLGVDGRITRVTVSVRKLRPPLPVDVATVGVRVTRHR